METTFWAAITIHYISLAAAITVNPAIIFVTASTFYMIPSLTQTELIPGIRTTLEAQIEVLKTMQYLQGKGYYE